MRARLVLCLAVAGVLTLLNPGRMLTSLVPTRTPGLVRAPHVRPVVLRGSLGDVSCESGSSCIAVGSAYTPAGPGKVLVEHLSRSSWTVMPAPTPADVTSADLSSISCTSAKACTAVGSSLRGAATTPACRAMEWPAMDDRGRAGARRRSGRCLWGRRLPIGFVVHGRRLLGDREHHEDLGGALERKEVDHRPTRNRPAVSNSSLSTVSCWSPNSCTAVGSATRTTSVTLAERSEVGPCGPLSALSTTQGHLRRVASSLTPGHQQLDRERRV